MVRSYRGLKEKKKRVMIDSDIFLQILKDQEKKKECEFELEGIKGHDMGYVTFLILGEIWKGLEEEFINIKKDTDNFTNAEEGEKSRKEQFLRIIDNLRDLLSKIKFLPVNKKALKITKELIEEDSGLRMGFQDRVNVATAIANECTYFLEIEKNIKEDEATLRKKGYKIKIKQI